MKMVFAIIPRLLTIIWPILLSRTKSENVCPTDVIIVIDNSGSVREVFEAEKQIAAQLVETLHVSPQETRVALIQFSDHPQILFSFADFADRDSVVAAIRAVPQYGGSTNTLAALEQALQDFARFARQEKVNHVILLITDGHSQNKLEDLQAAVMKLNDVEAIRIFAASASDFIGLDEFDIFTHGHRDRFFLKNNVTQLPQTVGQEILSGICRQADITPFPTPSRFSSADVQGYAPATSFVVTNVPTTTLLTTAAILPYVSAAPVVTTTTFATSKPAYVSEATRLVTTQPYAPAVVLTTTGIIATTTARPPTAPSTSGEAGPYGPAPPNTVSYGPTIQPTAPTAAPLPKGCQTDFLVVIDNSGSVEKFFEKEKDLAASLIDHAPVGPEAARVALIDFNANANSIFSFNTYNDRNSVSSALRNITQVGGTTNTESALRLAYDDINKFSRPGVNRVMLVVTDGLSQNTIQGLKAISKQLAEAGIVVYSASASEEIGAIEFNIYTNSHPERIFLKNNLTELLPTLQKVIAGGDCNGPPTTAAYPTAAITVQTPKPIVIAPPLSQLTIPTSPSTQTTPRINTPSFNIDQTTQRVTQAEPYGSTSKPSATAAPIVATITYRSTQAPYVPTAAPTQPYQPVAGYNVEEVPHTSAKPTQLPTAAAPAITTTAYKTTANPYVPAVTSTRPPAPITGYNVESTAQTRAPATTTAYRTTALPYVPAATTGAPYVPAVATTKAVQPAGGYGIEEVPQPTKVVVTRGVQPIAVTDVKQTEADVVSRQSSYYSLSTTPLPLIITTKLIDVNKSPTTNAITSSAVLTTERIVSTGCLLDLIFVLDSSGSVRRDFQKQLDFIIETIRDLDIRPSASRIAFVQYSGPDRHFVKVQFDNNQNKTELVQSIQALTFYGGTTATGKALDAAKMLLPQRRQSVPLIVVVLTDGFSQDDVTKTSASLRTEGAKVYAVGVVDSLNLPELVNIAGDPQRVFAGTDLAAVRRQFEPHISCKERN